MRISHLSPGVWFACLFPVCALAQQYTVTTIAGDGTAGFVDGAAASAEFSGPAAIAVGSDGKIYISDSANHRIRMLSNGTVSTFAGNGTAGYTGDNATATSAELNKPAGIALDSSGNLYIADTGNNVIRKVDTSGKITTVVGNSLAGYYGDTGAATAAEVNGPLALAFDPSGNYSISDTGNNVIRKIASLNITSTAGSGSMVGRLSHPWGIAFDSSGVLYIVDNGNNRIAKYTGTGTNPLTNFAGNQTTGFSGDGGPAASAQLSGPTGIAVDSAGNVYIDDSNNGRIRRISTSGVITTIAGNRGGCPYTGDGGLATNAGFCAPRGIALDSSGKIYIADSGNNVIRVLTPVAPAISSDGVTNAASFKPQVSPGALASIFGTGFATTTAQATTFPYPMSLGGVTVTVNGTQAPVFYVSSGQINFQIPWATTGSSANVVVTANNIASNTASVPVLSAGPGLFLWNTTNAVVQNWPDYTLNTSTNAIAAGGTVIAYLTGSGHLDTVQQDGYPASTTSLVRITDSCSATVGTQTAIVSFCGLAPGWVSLVQVDLAIPAGLAAGTYPLTVTIAGQSSNSANIYVK
jgi:uncharacterized protein (TIGR03437 family)